MKKMMMKVAASITLKVRNRSKEVLISNSHSLKENWLLINCLCRKSKSSKSYNNKSHNYFQLINQIKKKMKYFLNGYEQQDPQKSQLYCVKYKWRKIIGLD